MINNQTLKFLLPLVAIHNPYIYLRDEFVGAYIGDVDKPDNDGNLLLVYKYPMTVEWAEFEDKLKEVPEYLGSYDYGEQKIVVYKFSLEEYEEDFQLVMNGLYSKISPEAKLKVVKFWDRYSSSTLPKKILEVNESLLINWVSWNKDPKEYCAEGELWYIPDLDNEIFDKMKI